MNSVLSSLCLRTLHQDLLNLTDGELLASFLANPGERAFEVIVRRHGPMVLGVCRRVLRNDNDAEDAFQATFLVLVKKAAEFRSRGILGAWLHGVALRTALKARAAATIRRSKEQMAARSEFIEGHQIDDLGALLDEELSRLPDKYRIPLILCDMESKTRDAAARELGWPAGTVAGRLARARALLAERLKSRGLAIPAAVLLAGVGPNTTFASVPASLILSTIKAASLFATGQATAGVVSANAITLTKGVLKTMFWTKIKNSIILLVTLGLIGLVTCAVAYGIANTSSPEDPRETAQADEPKKPAQEGKSDTLPAKLDTQGDPLPDGAMARIGTTRWRHQNADSRFSMPWPMVTSVAYIANGTQLITTTMDGHFHVWDAASAKKVRQFGEQRTHSSYSTVSALSPDNKTLADLTPMGLLTLWDVTTGKNLAKVPAKVEMPLEGRPNYMSLAFSPDGKTVALRLKDMPIQMHEVPSGKEVFAFEDPLPKDRVDWGNSLAFLDQGKLILSLHHDAGIKKTVVRIFDAKTGKQRTTYQTPARNFQHVLPPWVCRLDWAVSPDGRTLASVDANGALIFQDAETGKVRHHLQRPADGAIYTMLTFSPDGKTLAARERIVEETSVVTQSGITFWDVEKGVEKARLAKLQINQLSGKGGGHYESNNLAFSPDGQSIAEVYADNTLRFFPVAPAKDYKPSNVPGHVRTVGQLALCPDGKTLVTCGDDCIVAHWDLATGKELRRCGKVGSVISANGNVAAKQEFSDALNHHFTIWDLQTGKQITRIQIPNKLFEPANPVERGNNPGLALSKDGKMLAVQNLANEILLYEARDKGKQIAHLKGPKLTMQSTRRFGSNSALEAARFRFTPLDDALVTYVDDNDHLIRFWGLDGGHPEHLNLDPSLNGQMLISMSFSNNGRYLALTRDRGISVVELLTGKEFATHGGASVFALSPSGMFLATGGKDKDVRVWNLITGKEIAKFSGHRGAISCLLFSADSKKLISGSTDTTAVVWNLGNLLQPEKAKGEWTGQTKVDLWNDLAADSKLAARAMNTLEEDPKQAIALLKEKLKPAIGANAKELRQWVDSLGSANFNIRQKATAELEKAGELAMPVLEEALAKKPNLETVRRIEQISEKLAKRLSPAELARGQRVVQILMQAASPEARALLEEIAQGISTQPLTRHAKTALIRLGEAR